MNASPALAVIGHNSPPEPTPFDLSRDEIEGLFMEAKNFLDGEPVSTQAQADAIGKLKHMLMQAGKRADERRADEKRPHDDAAAEVQSRYASLVANFATKTKAPDGKVTLALKVCDRALVPFLAVETARKAAVAEAARAEAQRRSEAAAAAFPASRHDDLAAREEAERLAASAKAAEADACRAEKSKASVGGGARVVTLRTIVTAKVTDRKAFLLWFAAHRPDELEGLLQSAVERLCSAQVRGLPGVTYTETEAVRS